MDPLYQPRMVDECGTFGRNNWKGRPRSSEKTYFVAILWTIKSMRSEQGSNLGPRDRGLATNHLKYCSATYVLLMLHSGWGYLNPTQYAGYIHWFQHCCFYMLILQLVNGLCFMFCEMCRIDPQPARYYTNFWGILRKKRVIICLAEHYKMNSCLFYGNKRRVIT